MIELVREAAKSLGAGKTAAAVDKLVAAWVALPAPRVAHLAARASARLPIEPLPSKIAEREAAWLARAAKANAKDLPTLLAAEWPVHPRGAKARLEPLLAFPPDPRIVLALHALWESDRYLSSAGIAFWRSALRTFIKWGDPIAVDMIREGRATERNNKSYVVKTFAKTKLPSPPKIDAALERELAALEAALGAPAQASNVDALFEAVYAEPAADAPRTVLADALLAANDPRGEFIQLQLAKPTGKIAARIKSLLRTHEKRWQGPLEPIIGMPIFRRGFVAEANIGPDGAYKPELREWRTVEAIRFRMPPKKPAYKAVAKFFAHDNLSGVRYVYGLPIAAIDTVASALERVDHLGVIAPYVPIKSKLRVRTLAVANTHFLQDGGTFERLSIDALFDWCNKLPFKPDALELDRFESDLVACWNWFAKSSIGKLSLKPGFVLDEPMAWELALSRDGALTATWHGRLYGEREPAGLGAALSALPTDALTSLVVTSEAKLDAKLRKSFLAELAPAIKRQKRLAKPSLFA